MTESRLPPGSGFSFPPEPRKSTVMNTTEDLNEQDIITFTLEHESRVSVEIYDLNGNKCAMIPERQFFPGDQQIHAGTSQLRIPAGKYVYYLQIENHEGVSRECRTISVS